MTSYLLDTNIIIQAGRSLDFQAHLDGRFDLFNPEVAKMISIVTTGELLVSAPPHILGVKRAARQERIIKSVTVVGLSNEIVQHYAEIDLFSRRKHPTRTSAFSARVMGKNDLWIAATASFFGVELITTDKDFEHLAGEFLTVHYVDPALAA